MKSNLSAEEKENIRSNHSLTRYLLSLRRGRPFTPRSWLYEGRSSESVLSEWAGQLAVLKTGDTYSKNVWAFEQTQLLKFGPQGGVEPISELDGTIDKTFVTSPPFPLEKELLWQQAKQFVTDEIISRTGKERLRPASYASVLDDMRARDTLASNSGYPLFARRKIPAVIKASISDAQSGKWQSYKAIALFRNYNKKTRLVWMYPLSVNLVEGSFVQPLQQALTDSGLAFYAPWTGFSKVQRLISFAYDSGETLYSSDFSSTDEHFLSSTTEQVYDVIKYAFQQRFWDQLRDSMLRVNSIGLIAGVDVQYFGEHGVSSGSRYTNFIETVFARIFSKYVELSTSTFSGLFGIGDDICWTSAHFDSAFSTLVSQFSITAGQLIKAEKTSCSPDSVVSLQRLFQRGYRQDNGDLVRAVYPTIRALNSLLHPEKFHSAKLWSSDMFCARTYMILENCVDHPLFEQFVTFVIKGNSHLVDFANKSARDLLEVTRQTKTLAAFNPTYNQEKRDTSLAAFESIRIASRFSKGK